MLFQIVCDAKYVCLVCLSVNLSPCRISAFFPTVFWNRLTNKYGTTFYVRDNGIDLAITNAVEAIVSCLRSEDQYCVQVPDAAPSLKSLGFS